MCLMPVRTLYMEKLQRSIFFFHHVMLYTQQRHKVADSGRTPRLSPPAQLSTCRSHTHTAQARRLCSFAHGTPSARPSQPPVSRTKPPAPLTHTRQSKRRRLGAEGHGWKQEHRQQRAAAVAQGLCVLSTLPPPQGGTLTPCSDHQQQCGSPQKAPCSPSATPGHKPVSPPSSDTSPMPPPHR